MNRPSTCACDPPARPAAEQTFGAAPPSRPTVFEELGNLDARIRGATDLVEDLEKRLSPILMPPPGDEKNILDEQPCSQVADEIRRQSARVNVLCGSLGSILERLEL